MSSARILKLYNFCSLLLLTASFGFASSNKNLQDSFHTIQNTQLFTSFTHQFKLKIFAILALASGSVLAMGTAVEEGQMLGNCYDCFIAVRCHSIAIRSTTRSEH